MKRLLSLLLLLQVVVLCAQRDYLVTSRGDTLYGKISFQKPTDYKEMVNVKTEEGNQSIISNELLVCFFKGEEYRSIRYGPKYRIMKLQIDGYLSLYVFRSDDSFEFSTKYLHKKSQEGVEVSTIGFRKRLTAFFEDCQELADAIENKTYRIGDLETIVAFYNENCVKDLDGALVAEGESDPNAQNDLKQLSELQQLLKDILTKKDQGEPIPQYLIEALASFTEKDVNNLLDALLKDLKENN